MSIRRSARALLFLSGIMTAAFCGAATDGLETRVFMNPDCYSLVPPTGTKNALPLAILGAVAEPLIDAVVDLGVAAIAKAAEDKTVDLPAATHFDRFYSTGAAGMNSMNDAVRCITVVSGNFENGDALTEQDMPGWLKVALSRIPQLDKKKFVGKPAIFFEADIILSDDRKQFALQPRAIYVGTFQQSSSWGRDKRKLDVALTFQDIASAQAYGSFLFSYRDIEEGYARLSCSTLTTSVNYADCQVNGAGPTQGWFQIQPETADMAKLSSARKGFAARLSTLQMEVADVGLAGPAVILQNLESGEHEHYCAALEAANKKVPEKAQKFDDLCPGAVVIAREAARADLALRQARLDYVDAYMLYNATCPAKPSDLSAAAAIKQRKALYVAFPVNMLAKPLSEAEVSACVRKAAKAKPAGEFTLSATLRETRSGSAIARFFAPVAKSSSADVKTLLKNELPARKNKAAEAQRALDMAAAALDRAAQQGVKVTDLEVLIAENELALAESATESPTKEKQVLEKQILLLKKKFEANNAYRAVGLDPRYSDVP